MKALKFLVIAMGVVIVAGFGVIAITIATRMADKREQTASGPEAPPPPAPWQTEVPLPDGCRLGEAKLDGGRLLLRLEGAASLGCGDLLLLDAESGRILGRIHPAPKEP
jgi:hypothetical protein